MQRNKKYLVTLICFLCALQIQGQNLLLNGDFENNIKCPKGPGEIEFCIGWRMPNASTPDFFKACGDTVSVVGVPYNAVGVQEPFLGNAYAGIVLFNGEYKAYREYIEGELINPLEKDLIYEIKLQISWAEHSSYFYESLGFKLTDKRMNGWKGKVKYKNLIRRSSGSIELSYDKLKNRDSWHEVSILYKARGGERFISFGLFGDNATEEQLLTAMSTPYVKVNRHTGMCYLYLDSISVTRNK